MSFVPKKSKSVLLVSTMHHDDKIDDQTGKPDIILYYNQTKAEVDTVDQMCHTYSIKRKTKRWPLAYFMNLLNLNGPNSCITYITWNPQWCQKLFRKQRQFLEDLGLDVVKPIIESRTMSFVGLTKPIQQAMSDCGITPAASVDYSQDEQGSIKSKRKRCNAIWIESLLGSAQSAKKMFVPTILPRRKKSNAELHVSYRNYVFF